MNRHAAEIDAIRRDIINAGRTERAAIEAALSGTTTGPMAAYLAKVAEASYRITDEEVAALRVSGIAEDEIFELTIAAAFGAASRRLDAGRRALASS